MATLAESFLADLDDLSDESDQEEQEEHGEDGDEEMAELPEEAEPSTYESLDSVARLINSDRYKSIMERVKEEISLGDAESRISTGPTEDDPTYKLLVECNQLAVDIDNEISSVHNFMRDQYRLKFPELESLVHHPIDYARVIKAIGNETDITLVNLDDILPQATIMVVSVTASTTSGKPMTDEALQLVLGAADVALQLDTDKTVILDLVSKRMHRIAPNLSEVVGTEIAAKLMGVAGGLINLAKMPACNVQVLGAKRKSLAGFSTSTVTPHQGFISQCDLIQRETPPGLRAKAARLVGAKCVLVARVDAHGHDPSGESGRSMLAEMRKKVEKWQEPPQAKQTRVLPAPDMENKKRRGGRRQRKLKERYGQTDVRKAANRVNFNQPEEEFIDGDDVVGLGVLGKTEGSGRLRLQVRTQTQKINAKTAKKLKGRISGITAGTSGLSSSLAFTPIQGIELVDPGMKTSQDLGRTGTESYFSDYSGFRSLKK